MLSALAGTPVPVPRVLCLCTDAAVAGTPFYVMEHVEVRTYHLLGDQHAIVRPGVWPVMQPGASCCALSLTTVCVSRGLRYHWQWKAHAGCTWNQSASYH